MWVTSPFFCVDFSKEQSELCYSGAMNVVKEINRINQREAVRDLSAEASWHAQYKDSAYIFIGGLSYDLTEGDIICAFSQYVRSSFLFPTLACISTLACPISVAFFNHFYRYGEVVDINYVRDKKTGKPKGFAFLQYEDQKSTILAVDNLNGTKIDGRTLRVDHVENYKQPKNEDGTEPDAPSMNAIPQIVQDDSDTGSASDDLAGQIDPEDPMAEYILKKLRKERKRAKKGEKKKKHKHRDENDEDDGEKRAKKKRKHRDENDECDGEKRTKRAESEGRKGEDDDEKRAKKSTENEGRKGEDDDEKRAKKSTESEGRRGEDDEKRAKKSAESEGRRGED
ncbi:hypothetical protein BC936DRAFT_147880, partial [Jimgerdemannia flammicorona]